MSEFTRSLLSMKKKDDQKFEFEQKIEIIKKNVVKIIDRAQWNDPRFKKDNERSTWFLNNTKYNYKMKNWVENFHIQERFKKIKKIKNKEIKLAKIQNIEELTYLEQGDNQITNQKEDQIEIFESQDLQDYDYNKHKQRYSQKQVQTNQAIILETIQELSAQKHATPTFNRKPIKFTLPDELLQVDQIQKEYPQGEVVSSIELSNDSESQSYKSKANKSIMSDINSLSGKLDGRKNIKYMSTNNVGINQEEL